MPDETITFGESTDHQHQHQQGQTAATVGSGFGIRQKLIELQATLKVEKGQWNDFGKYKYRSKEDILEAAKPLCRERGLLLLVDDDVTCMPNGWVYVRATAAIVDALTFERIEAHGWAREPESKKDMDGSQITGTASSYAGKRALGNLFAIDDTKDSDALPTGPAQKSAPAQGPFSARCKACGHVHQFPDKANFDQWVAYWQQGGPENRCCPTPTLEVI